MLGWRVSLPFEIHAKSVNILNVNPGLAADHHDGELFTAVQRLDGPRARRICLIPRRFGSYSGSGGDQCNQEDLSIVLSASRAWTV
jgi:hypothetical protein